MTKMCPESTQTKQSQKKFNSAKTVENIKFESILRPAGPLILVLGAYLEFEKRTKICGHHGQNLIRDDIF